MRNYLLITVISLLCLSCTSRKDKEAQPIEAALQYRMAGGGDASALPRATAFRMNGNYADKVGVTLNPDGSLAYYPAPTDITPMSAPAEIGDGWWLNRQGISGNSVFTKWTFSEYAALKSTPTKEEILAAIIPGASVTEMVQLPVSYSEARENPARCLLFLKNE